MSFVVFSQSVRSPHISFFDFSNFPTEILSVDEGLSYLCIAYFSMLHPESQKQAYHNRTGFFKIRK